MVIECKLLHGGLSRTISDGAAQTRAYLDRCGAAEGHLVIFDRTPDRPWERKLFRRQAAGDGAPITVWACSRDPSENRAAGGVNGRQSGSDRVQGGRRLTVVDRGGIT